MTKERWTRKEELIAYVEDNLRRLEAGEIIRLPTYQSLAEQFGYAGNPSVYMLLKRKGIRLKNYAPPYKLPGPSSDLAWFLGTLSSGGSVRLIQGWTWLANTNEAVLEKFRLIGERLFSLNANKITAGGERSWGGSQPGYQFNSVKIARFLGDLREDSWARTILYQHPWVVDDSKYTWGFINGFFEERGSVHINETPYKTQHRIRVSTPSPNGASLLAEMLVRQGLEYPSVQYEFRSGERVKGVRVQNLRDIRLFAQNIHSVVPEKEEALECLRYRVPLTGHYDHKPKYTTERLIEEWKKVSNALDGNPTAKKIRNLRKDGKTEISDMTYAARFGQGNFVKAREELERIIKES